MNLFIYLFTYLSWLCDLTFSSNEVILGKLSGMNLPMALCTIKMDNRSATHEITPNNMMRTFHIGFTDSRSPSANKNGSGSFLAEVAVQGERWSVQLGP